MSVCMHGGVSDQPCQKCEEPVSQIECRWCDQTYKLDDAPPGECRERGFCSYGCMERYDEPYDYADDGYDPDPPDRNAGRGEDD